MAWSKGINFRANNTDSGYVNIDPAGTTYTYVGGAGAGEWYPTTRDSVTFGWLDPGAGNWRNRVTGGDGRLAGTCWAASGPQYFIVDLPQAGTYTVDLALGDPSGGAGEVSSKIYDGDTGTTLLATLGPATLSSGQFMDAGGNTRANEATWVSSHATVNLTFGTTKFRISLERNLASLSHLNLTLVESAKPTYIYAQQ
jgi:hypothetical protein